MKTKKVKRILSDILTRLQRISEQTNYLNYIIKKAERNSYISFVDYAKENIEEDTIEENSKIKEELGLSGSVDPRIIEDETKQINKIIDELINPY